jgi:chemotaxis protein methyltransferase CheR
MSIPTISPLPASPFHRELKVTDEEFRQLRDFIYAQCGIFIGENRKYLIENRLAARI